MTYLEKFQRIKIVQWFYERKSITTVGRKFQKAYGKKAPKSKSIKNLIEKFEAEGSVATKKRSGRPKAATSD